MQEAFSSSNSYDEFYSSGGNNTTTVLADTTPPASITGLANISYSMTYINWTWTDPSDPDLTRVVVYLDGAYKDDVIKGVQYYNTSVVAGTYTIGTRTVDTAGNMNATLATHTASTMLPLVRFINGTIMESVSKEGIAGATVSSNKSVSTITNASGFYSLAVPSGAYDLTGRFEPMYYANSTVTVFTASSAVVVQDIELMEKPTGTISGAVTNT